MTIAATLENAGAIRAKVLQEATDAAKEVERRQGGDVGACGFAWVTIFPAYKGNTRAGRAERALLRAIGAELNWSGKAFDIWNPSKYHGQSVAVKYAGAEAAAKILRLLGFDATAEDRLD